MYKYKYGTAYRKTSRNFKNTVFLRIYHKNLKDIASIEIIFLQLDIYLTMYPTNSIFTEFWTTFA